MSWKDANDYAESTVFGLSILVFPSEINNM